MTPSELRARRRALALTQEQLARALGVTGNTVARWERGARAIARPDLVRLAFERLEGLAASTHGTHALENGAVVPRHGPAARPAHNLPAELSSFVGRRSQLHELVALLGTVRLLTLTGAGGVGKTRLAHRLASLVLEEYPAGVWLVDLAPLADPGLVDQAVASVLHVRPQPGRRLVATLAESLSPRRLLLLLDNCEHVLPACAALTEAVLHACPDVRVLTTSREPLRLPGETVWRVPSLSLPEAGRDLPVDQLVDYEAIQLFCARARATCPAFSLTDQNRAAVVQVCRQLDGIPLALELATARVELLAVEQIAARLDDRLQLLTDGCRTAPPRQQTLHAAVAWSYELLDEPERRLLARLSVFAGGWTPEAAEAICAGSDLPARDVLGLVGRLVSKSLVQVEQRASGARHRLLETIRQFAAERLRAAGDEARLRGRHRDWFLALADQAAEAMPGPGEQAALDRLDPELDNLRLAFEWCATDAAGLEAGLRVGGRLWWFWYTRNHWREGRAQLERLLAQAGPAVPAAARADALYALGNVLRAQGELVAARSVQQACSDLRRAIGDRSGLAHSLAELGRIARGLGEYDAAVALLRQALALQEELGEQWGIARQLNALGHLARLEGDLERATELHQRGLSVSRAIGDSLGVSTDLASLASLAYARGQLACARALLIESLGMQRAVGSVWGMADKLELLAGIVGRLRRPHDAVLLFSAAEGLREWLGDWRGEWRPDQHERYRRDVALTRAQLGEAVFEAGLAAGRRLELDQALDLALGLRDAGRLASSGPLRTPAMLSSREREVARLVATGLTNRQIAGELVITEATAAKHVENIRAKLGVTSRTHIAAWVLNTPEPAAR